MFNTALYDMYITFHKFHQEIREVEIHLCPLAKHNCHCVDLHDTDICLMTFHKEYLWQIS